MSVEQEATPGGPSISVTANPSFIESTHMASPHSALPIPPGYVFDNVIIRNVARVVADDALVVSNGVEILTGSILTHSLEQTNGLRISARRIEVDATSSIDVSGRGYRGGRRDGNPNNEGFTLGGILGSTYRSGGSYGGLGGSYDGYRNQVYGHPADPIHLGSGGSCGSSYVPGGNGGGRVNVIASEAVVVEGTIRANGGTGNGNIAGDGSGGSIRIETALLRGTGEIEANGGQYQAGGGGGRVAIDYAYLGSPGDDLNGSRNITAFGGHGSHRWGSAGTVLLRRQGQTHGDLYIDDNLPTQTSTAWTPMTHIGFGAVSWLTNDTLRTDGRVAMIPNGLVGLEINPNLLQETAFTVSANTETTITVNVSGGTNLTDVASVSDEYAGVYRFDNVFFRRGGFLVMGDELRVGNAMLIDEHGVLTHYDATATFDSRLRMSVEDLDITTNGAIDVSGRGYPGGRSSGNTWNEGQTTNHTAGAAYRSGGSYGGLGASYSGGTPNPIYGSETNPVHLGSGGSCGSSYVPGGDGGGWITIYAGTTLVHGVLSAGGDSGGGNLAGSGSGGTIYIETGSLGGSGTIHADGGAYQLGGGGGRIAIYFPAASSDTNDLTASAAGGVGSHGSAAAGSVHLDDTYTWLGLPGSGGSGGSSSGSDGAYGFVITGIDSCSGGSSVILWSDAKTRASGGRASAYAVEFSSELDGTNWRALDEAVFGNSWTGAAPGATRQGFFRIRRQE